MTTSFPRIRNNWVMASSSSSSSSSHCIKEASKQTFPFPFSTHVNMTKKSSQPNINSIHKRHNHVPSDDNSFS
uniref:Uncharacterized protein n=1 Tax=Glossina brevipalpis TaxID=37001 RepID=A0A1A9WS04_9MUSC